jgi:serine/threonine-protein kinase
VTAAAKEAQELAGGQRLLERYSIIDRVASGGMATIYRANDDRLDRVVCVKLLRTTVTGSGSTSGGAVYQATYDHFLQEALALSKLQHPNTLKIFDFGFLHPNRPFQISEYLDGGNLEGHVRHRGALPHPEIISILDKMAGAVAEAHEHKIIHRDIKPSNILFARVAEALMPKLADFGIANNELKRDDENRSESVSTVTLFSPRWAAPEQLCGAPEGPYTDVYALGLLTAYMLTGQIPFSDQDVRETFTERVNGDEFVAERLVWLGIGGDIGRVLFATLRSKPQSRIQSAPDAFDAIRTALRGSSSISMPAVQAPLHGIAQNAHVAVPPPSAPRHTPTPPPASQPQPVKIPPPAIIPHTVQMQPQESLKMGLPDSPHDAQEHSAAFGTRVVRYVAVDEKLDLSFLDAHGGEVRFRVSFLPTRDSLNIKGLNCFVAKQGGRASPALTANGDGVAELVSTKREILGNIGWSFGTPSQNGRLFLVDGAQLVVPYPEATQAVVLFPSRGRDLVVMMRR